MGSKPKHVKLREERNRPPDGEPWVWLTRELLESDAWRTAPINTRRVVERVALEHMAHAGTMNGKLVCTYTDFAQYGVAKRYTPGAIADAGARGLVNKTQQGSAAPGIDRWPSQYALGWLPMHDGAAAPNRWKAYQRSRKPRKSDPTNVGAPSTQFRQRPPYKGRAARPYKCTAAFSENGGNRHPTNVGYSINLAGDTPAAIPRDGHDLPPGWRIVKGASGQVRILKPNGNGQWVELPIVDNPQVGTESERAALAELKAWRSAKLGNPKSAIPPKPKGD